MRLTRPAEWAPAALGPSGRVTRSHSAGGVAAQRRPFCDGHPNKQAGTAWQWGGPHQVCHLPADRATPVQSLQVSPRDTSLQNVYNLDWAATGGTDQMPLVDAYHTAADRSPAPWIPLKLSQQPLPYQQLGEPPDFQKEIAVNFLGIPVGGSKQSLAAEEGLRLIAEEQGPRWPTTSLQRFKQALRATAHDPSYDKENDGTPQKSIDVQVELQIPDIYGDDKCYPISGAGREEPELGTGLPQEPELGTRLAGDPSLKQLKNWTVDDVSAWVASTPLPPEVSNLLQEHAINGPVLDSLTDKDLVAMGFHKFGWRRQLLLSRQELRDRMGPRIFNIYSSSSTPAESPTIETPMKPECTREPQAVEQAAETPGACRDANLQAGALGQSVTPITVVESVTPIKKAVSTCGHRETSRTVMRVASPPPNARSMCSPCSPSRNTCVSMVGPQVKQNSYVVAPRVLGRAASPPVLRPTSQRKPVVRGISPPPGLRVASPPPNRRNTSPPPGRPALARVPSAAQRSVSPTARNVGRVRQQPPWAAVAMGHRPPSRR